MSKLCPNLRDLYVQTIVKSESSHVKPHANHLEASIVICHSNLQHFTVFLGGIVENLRVDCPRLESLGIHMGRHIVHPIALDTNCPMLNCLNLVEIETSTECLWSLLSRASDGASQITRLS